MSQEYLDARAQVMRQTTSSIVALVIWELTHSTDLRRFERARFLLMMAHDIEARYGTRVADVDPDRHGYAAGGARTHIVDDGPLMANPDYMPLPDIPPATIAANRRAVAAAMRDGILPTAVRVCRADDVGAGVTGADMERLAQPRTDEEIVADADQALRHADRMIADARALIADAGESLQAIDPAADANTMAGAIAAEARLRDAHRAIDALPPRVADDVIERVNRTPIEPRRGAPYDRPPPIGTTDLVGLADQLGVPHMRPMMAGMQAAIAPMLPDPMTRLANRLTALIDARSAQLSVDENADVTALDRQITRTQAQIDQLESDSVPEPKAVPPEPREIT